ncbi:MAG: tyrosine-type recombinase/integrase [Candidatus Berkelbacteria bacterium]|nr:tyrosine-type recombinase/integrase [Candidatus Berkelbacteria bacterium]
MFDKLVMEYLEHLEIEKNSSILTLRNYRHYLNRFSNWLKGHSPSLHRDVTKIDLETIRKYRLYLSRLQDKNKGSLKKSTQNYHVIALRAFFRYLIRKDMKVLAPEKIDLPKTESHSLKFLNHEQTEILLAQPDTSNIIGLRDKTILEILFSTGLRVAEIAKLNTDQINLKTKEFGVIGKGGRARVVFLSDSACEWILKYLQARKDEYKPLFVRYSRGVDVEKKGENMRLTTRTIERIVEKYVKKAGLSVKATCHTLRHTFATDLLQSGADLRSVQELLGHKNISTTQIYTHVTNPQLKAIHQKFHHKFNKEKE